MTGRQDDAGDSTAANPAEAVGSALAERSLTLAVAESCTGGLLAKLITDVPGSSRYFACGWVTYSNRAKTTELAVEQNLIEQFGAVSGEVASSMALGALRQAGTDFALAVTGIAGPGGGTRRKPTGLVFIALAGGGRCETKKFVFSGNRDLIRQKAAREALNMLRDALRI